MYLPSSIFLISSFFSNLFFVLFFYDSLPFLVFFVWESGGERKNDRKREPAVTIACWSSRVFGIDRPLRKKKHYCKKKGPHVVVEENRERGGRLASLVLNRGSRKFAYENQGSIAFQPITHHPCVSYATPLNVPLQP